MKDKTQIQKLINGKPSEFARRIGCPKSTANHYSNGTRTPPEWVYELIKDKIDNDFVMNCGFIPTVKQRIEINKLKKTGLTFQQARASLILKIYNSSK